jgi:hypothetical protein
MPHPRHVAVAAALLATAATPLLALPFRITVENLGPQPLSPIFAATTNGGFDLFTAGQAAPTRIEQIAEDGVTTAAEADASTAQTAGSILDWQVVPGGVLMPGQTRVFTLEATSTHRWLQWATMLGMSNDAFLGSGLGLGDQQIDLYSNGSPLHADFTVSFLMAWDAGTELNTEQAAHLGAFGNPGVGPAENGVIAAPHSGIRGDADIPGSFNWYGGDLARMTITPVPEPGTLTLLGLGAWALVRRRQR